MAKLPLVLGASTLGGDKTALSSSFQSLGASKSGVAHALPSRRDRLRTDPYDSLAACLTPNPAAIKRSMSQSHLSTSHASAAANTCSAQTRATEFCARM